MAVPKILIIPGSLRAGSHNARLAALAAKELTLLDAEVTRMVAAFRRRRDYLVDRFRSEVPGIEFVEPHGAFYFFFRVDGIRESDPVTGQSFCEQLMKQEGVALVPGAAPLRSITGASNWTSLVALLSVCATCRLT